MDTHKYRQYCKKKKNFLEKRPDYATFRDSWGASLILGLILGLGVGIWQNFFPAPTGVFKTIGAVMFTVVYCGAGATIGLICAPLFLLVKNALIRQKHKKACEKRRNRLADNGLVQELVKRGQEKQVCAILINDKGIRLYDHIPDEEYCEDDKEIQAVHSVVGLNEAEQNFVKKDHWLAYDRSFCQELLFAKEGFEDMDDDTQMELANYLCAQLKDWAVSTHRAYAFYNEVSGGDFDGTFTYNSSKGTLIAGRSPASVSEVTRELYSDYFVFDLEAAFTASRSRRKGDAAAPQKW